MLETISTANVAPTLDQTWRVTDAQGNTVEFVLTKITENPKGAMPDAIRVPFNMVFRGPTEPALPQGTYKLEHAAIGCLEDVLVRTLLPPLDANKDEALYYQVSFG
ncbi:DUF6916 family protein [Azospirillum sp. sgz302134]